MLTKKKLLARIKELEYQIAGEKTARMALAHEVQAIKETTQTALDALAAQLSELAEKKAQPACMSWLRRRSRTFWLPTRSAVSM